MALRVDGREGGERIRLGGREVETGFDLARRERVEGEGQVELEVEELAGELAIHRRDAWEASVILVEVDDATWAGSSIPTEPGEVVRWPVSAVLEPKRKCDGRDGTGERGRRDEEGRVLLSCRKREGGGGYGRKGR